MLCERPVVNEVSGLFCHVNEPLSFSLQRLFHLLVPAVSKWVKFFAGVAGIDGIVGAVRMNWEGACTDVSDVLCVDHATDSSFGSGIAALHDFSGQETAHNALIGGTLAECFLFDPCNVGGCRDVSSRRNRAVVAKQFGNHVCRSSLVRQTLTEMMSEQPGYLVRLVYPSLTQFMLKSQLQTAVFR